MSFKELSEIFDIFDRLPLWGKILLKIFADGAFVVGMIIALVEVLINYIAGKDGY